MGMLGSLHIPQELKRESYGVELLQTIGFVYVSKAKHHLATNQSFLGVGGWLHNVQGKYHVFSKIVSTLHPTAEKARNLTPEEKKRLEEQAAEIKGTKLEVESILRETCERLLSDPACLVVDVLGLAARSHVTERFVALEFKEYRHIFHTNDEKDNGQTTSTMQGPPRSPSPPLQTRLACKASPWLLLPVPPFLLPTGPKP
ncbi:X-domain of DnaJ-containing-domain-containing protein [Pholiota molesta]|nr:X-domain of DnaJ-containing-domain-containing protein [Pholiota molesta]